MLGVRGEENAAALTVYCQCCDAEVGVMEWMADAEHGKATCPWCSENFYIWTDKAFDPEDVLGLRARSR